MRPTASPLSASGDRSTPAAALAVFPLSLAQRQAAESSTTARGR
ncbi:hypothetical protein [Streptomyces sp. NPDC056512]